jgi:hypothetical protein
LAHVSTNINFQKKLSEIGRGTLTTDISRKGTHPNTGVCKGFAWVSV